MRTFLSSWSRSLALTLLCTSVLAHAQGTPEAFEGDDLGLEPPGVQYLPAPPPRAHEQRRLSPDAPAVVRRETRAAKSNVKTAGVPQTRRGEGALSGKVIYLSPGHGFYRDNGLKRWATQRPNTWGVVEDFISVEVVSQELQPMLMAAGATVVSVRETDLNPLIATVDNGGTGYVEDGDAARFHASTQKGWAPPPVPMGNGVEPFTLGSTRTLDTAATSTAKVTWTPDVPADAAYNVYVSYGSDPTRATDAHYVVKHAGGESHFRVNQQRHGGTWVLLGRFYFKASQHPESGAVVLENDSAQGAGATLSVDAVRLGGGRGLMGDAAQGPLLRPRFEESGRYHVQYSGAPFSVYAPSGANALSNERNADVTSRPRFAAWLHEEGEDAVYVAWHTNAGTSGTIRGTEAYVYGPNPVDGTLNFTGVKDSDVMARALLSQIETDIKREVDPNWRVRSLRSANLGEVNPSHNPEMPSVLLEMAYHDNTTDAANLKEARVRHVAARAITQGLIKYFATRDGAAVHLPPETPGAVAARNATPGAVEVKWTAPPQVASEEGRDAPTGYRLYQSADGFGWDEGTEIQNTSATVTLSSGTLRYFRVAAVNAGGESFPSATVGVRVGDTAPVLLVNAYERLDRTVACGEELETPYDLEAPLRVYLEAMNDGSYLRQHGAAFAQSAVAFDSATGNAVAAGLVSPAGYRLVDWSTGRGGVGGAGLTRTEQDALRAFVTGGGHLMLSGGRTVSTLAAGTADDKLFLTDILRASIAAGAPVARVQGSAGGLLADLAATPLADGTLGAYPVGVTDVLAPTGGGADVLRYTGTSLGAGVLSAGTAPAGQVLVLGFPFEGLASNRERSRLVGAFLVRSGLVTQAPALPDADVTPAVSPRPLSSCVAVREVDPHPPVDPGPVDPEPQPTVIPALPNDYSPKGDSGCGCGAGAGTASGLWLLVGVIVQLRRARAKAAHAKR
ncbi:N-acetylmuramoyl-L-alanine amidase [Corallococcus sp. AB032C]|uniref:golvesin C-terminal-like domain-containing protein n=1 Tax=Corallococcus TaxID=83461 RepID=UPI000ED6E5CD|nr:MULTISPECIES: N-acetylmuramoyl-L-alanine amidase [Corallococcus]NPC46764.1 N-acetylmuramoyl-L-alanine amidase [Corallococcus exiguus]RKH87397.1 N-acetylmuramoyl-L-alanine amidase [Corallococcus sp. AB032C]